MGKFEELFGKMDDSDKAEAEQYNAESEAYLDGLIHAYHDAEDKLACIPGQPPVERFVLGQVYFHAYYLQAPHVLCCALASAVERLAIRYNEPGAEMDDSAELDVPDTLEGLI